MSHLKISLYLLRLCFKMNFRCKTFFEDKYMNSCILGSQGSDDSNDFIDVPNTKKFHFDYCIKTLEFKFY